MHLHIKFKQLLDQWRIQMKIVEYIDDCGDENTRNIWNLAKAVLRGNFKALNAYTNK